MTDKIKALTVVLTEDMREDDVEPLVQAIRQFQHVADVQAEVADVGSYTAYVRAKQDLWNKIVEVLDL